MNRRDIELLSAYLDGELKPADSIKLEARLKTDIELASVLNDLRATRTLLRRLPSRKAPRNFTLTRKMVGLNPPLPRTYPIFKLVTAVASLLLFFSFAVNSMGPQLMSADNFGRGGGAAEVESFVAEAPALEQAAAPAPEEPAAASGPADMMPAPTQTGVAGDTSNSGEPSIAMAPPQGTQVPSTDEALRIIETPFAKNGDIVNTSEAQSLPPMVSSIWQVVLAVIVVTGFLLLWWMRRSSARRWK